MVNTFYIGPSTLRPFDKLRDRKLRDRARSVPTHHNKKCILRVGFQGLRCTRNRSLLDVNEDFECERNAESTP